MRATARKSCKVKLKPKIQSLVEGKTLVIPGEEWKKRQEGRSKIRVIFIKVS